jgi:hypothetical protein
MARKTSRKEIVDRPGAITDVSEICSLKVAEAVAFQLYSQVQPLDVEKKALSVSGMALAKYFS